MNAPLLTPPSEALTDLVRVFTGDVLAVLRGVADETFHCIVTSPPYLDARDYGVVPTAWPTVTYRPRFDLPEVTVPATTCCLGHETSMLAYVGHLVLVARELRRVLRRDGVLWLNLGAGFSSGTTAPRKPTTTEGPHVPASWKGRCHGARVTGGLPAKQLIRAPSAVCDALQADGWFVRNEVAWVKPNAKPDSVRDRMTTAHEVVFVLTREPRYYFDALAIATPARSSRSGNVARVYGPDRGRPSSHQGASIPWAGDTAHPRDVWTIPVGRFTGAHFATFPVELARRCIVAGTSEVGCCPACGAPWQRILARGEPVHTGGSRRKHTSILSRQGANGAMVTGVHHPRVCAGWKLGCACPLARPVPCRVLDPFGGSGTSGVVAHLLGRDSTLIDAQPDYLPLMRQRVVEMLAQAAKPGRSARAKPRPIEQLPLGGVS